MKSQSLRNTVIHKKKKRKRGKVMHLYDPEEKEGQALFFSPAKDRAGSRVSYRQRVSRRVT